MIAKPNVPEALPWVRSLYRRDVVGCCWHSVLSDRNVEDALVMIIAQDVLSGVRGCSAEACRELARLLPRMSRTQRRKLAGQKIEPWRSPSDAHRVGGGYRSPCRGCGYLRKRLPPWAKHGAIFALRGRAYRIVSCGSSNGGTPGNMHFRDRVLAAPLDEIAPTLPDVPCAKAAVADALDQIFALPAFTAEDLQAALHVALI